MALVKKTVQDFNEVFAPKSTTVEQDDYEEDETNLERQNSPLAVDEAQTTHVNSTLIETQAREKNAITSTGLLNSDSLNKQQSNSDAQEEETTDQFDVIQEQDIKSAEIAKK